MNTLIKITAFALVVSLVIAEAKNTATQTMGINITPKTKLIIEQGDITHSKVKAIVNAANEQLAGGAGVCGAIFKAAGAQQLQTACNKNAATNTVRCPTGDAKITSSYALKSRGIDYIIHAVGPDCRIITDETMQDDLLQKTYNNSLVLADQNNINSLAFPFISSAIYAFPKERAAQIAINTIIDYVSLHEETTHIDAIHFVLFSVEDYDLFCATLQF